MNQDNPSDRMRRRAFWGWIVAALLTLASIALVKKCSASEIYVKDTGSMKGWIAPGGRWYHLQAVDLGSVKVGQVIVWKAKSGILVCHRVIEADKGKLWTKGDSNKGPDNEWVTKDNFKGLIQP